MEYLDLAKKFVQDTELDPITADVLERWESVLDRLVDDPMSCAREIDWVTKLQILEGYRSRDGLDWDAHTLALVDLQFHDVRPDKGLYNKLAQKGRVDRLLDEDDVTRAMSSPPEDTRAYFRGRCLEKYAAQVAAASWDSVIFDIGRDSLQRVPTLEPTRGTKAHVGALLDRCDTAAELVDALTT
jgi:proteasome accessory factor A